MLGIPCVVAGAHGPLHGEAVAGHGVQLRADEPVVWVQRPIGIVVGERKHDSNVGTVIERGPAKTVAVGVDDGPAAARGARAVERLSKGQIQGRTRRLRLRCKGQQHRCQHQKSYNLSHNHTVFNSCLL